MAALEGCLGCWRVLWALRAFPGRTWSRCWRKWGNTLLVGLQLPFFLRKWHQLKSYFIQLFVFSHHSPAKNVAADISFQLCESVAKKLEGKVMGTFTSEYIYHTCSSVLSLCFVTLRNNILFGIFPESNSDAIMAKFFSSGFEMIFYPFDTREMLK